MKLIALIFLYLTTLVFYANDSKEEIYQLSDFVVTDKSDNGYFSGSSTSVTKANELIKNTPVNVSVINKELLDDLGINTTEDLAMVTSSIDTDPNSYSLDQIRIRGFRNTSTRFNGFRRTLARDGYNIARYVIIKGANSMIFGQASPGGTVNAQPLLANFRKDSGSITFSIGNKDYTKKTFNYNKIFSDKLAIRLMMLDHYQGYEHAYKNYDLKSNTLAINYRPDYTSSIKLHLERIDSSFSFPTLSLKDDTRIDDSIDGKNTSDSIPYDGYLSSSENKSMASDFNVPFNSEWLNFAEDRMLLNLLIHTRNNESPTAISDPYNLLNNSADGVYPIDIAPGDPAPEIHTGDYLSNDFVLPTNNYIQLDKDDVAKAANAVRKYLQEYYSIIDDSNYGYQSGPDKNKTVSGNFNTLDFQKVLRDGLEFSISLNYQKQKGKNIARDNYGITKVRDHYNDSIKYGWPFRSLNVFVDNVPESLLRDTYEEDYGLEFMTFTTFWGLTTRIPVLDTDGNLKVNENNYYSDGTLTDYEAALDTISPEPYIRTYWTKTESQSKRNGLKSTLLYEKDFNLPKIGKLENKFLFGWDSIRINKSEIKYDQIPITVEIIL